MPVQNTLLCIYHLARPSAYSGSAPTTAFQSLSVSVASVVWVALAVMSEAEGTMPFLPLYKTHRKPSTPA